MLIPIGFFGGAVKLIYGKTYTAYSLPAAIPAAAGGAYATGGGHVLARPYSDTYYTSANARTWTTRTWSGGADYISGPYAINSNGTTYLRGGGNQWYRSTDGINWTYFSTPNANSYKTCSYAGGWWFLTTEDGNQIAWSTDTVNWGVGTRGSNYGGRISYANGYWVNTRPGSDFGYTTNISTWTRVTNATYVDGEINSNGTNLFMAMKSYGATNYHTFTNPSDFGTWVSRTQPVVNSYKAPFWAGENWVILPTSSNDSNTYAYSEDGATWTIKTGPGSTYSFAATWFGNKQFVSHLKLNSGNYLSNIIWLSEGN